MQDSWHPVWGWQRVDPMTSASSRNLKYPFEEHRSTNHVILLMDGTRQTLIKRLTSTSCMLSIAVIFYFEFG